MLHLSSNDCTRGCSSVCLKGIIDQLREALCPETACMSVSNVSRDGVYSISTSFHEQMSMILEMSFMEVDTCMYGLYMC